MSGKNIEWKSRVALAVGLIVFCSPLFSALAQQDNGTLDPTTIPKYVDQLPIPSVMPNSGNITQNGMKNAEYYEIAVRQFEQQILPGTDTDDNLLPATKIWGYGSVNHPESFRYPAFTIEASVDKPVRIKWINDLKDPMTGKYLPHLFAVDQTLHWANPPGDCVDHHLSMNTSGHPRTDCRGSDPKPYKGPVPISPHLHGAHVGPESDGYPEAWWLPDANIPDGYAIKGSKFDQFDRNNTDPGTAVFQYPNDQAAATLWYHDHTLGMTRLNVYAGPLGFYLLRGGNTDVGKGVLPGPAPAPGDPPGKKYYEIPIAIQDKAFNKDGSLFYPDNRAFFEGLIARAMLSFQFIPQRAPFLIRGTNNLSDVSPIWNPEYFGNTMVVNGKTWPTLTVEPRRYRFRLLNGCDSRFLYLKLYKGEPGDQNKPLTRPTWVKCLLSLSDLSGRLDPMAAFFLLRLRSINSSWGLPRGRT